MQQNPYAKLAQNSADVAQQPGMGTAAGLNDSAFVGPQKPVQEDEVTRARKKILLQYLFGDLPGHPQIVVNGNAQ